MASLEKTEINDIIVVLWSEHNKAYNQREQILKNIASKKAVQTDLNDLGQLSLLKQKQEMIEELIRELDPQGV